MLRACGYRMTDSEEGADCIVINTCAIREHAETRVYGNVGALVHTKKPPSGAENLSLRLHDGPACRG